MSLEVKIEIRSTVKKKANCFADGITHDFIVFVQGHNGNHIEHFIKEIVFYLPFNSNSKQVRRKPPYFIQGSTQASFRLPIDLFFHTTINLFKMSISYYLLVPDKPLENAVCVKTLTFLNTPQDFKERLLLGGAEEAHHEKNSDAVATRVTCKSEPVEIIENQEEVHHQKNSDAVATHVTCKSEPVEIIENQEEVYHQKNSDAVAAHVTCKSEPVESIENQEEVHHLMNSDAVATHSTCKSEPVEIIENQEKVHHLMNSDAVATHATCKSEPVEIIENQEKVHHLMNSDAVATNSTCKSEPVEIIENQEEVHHLMNSDAVATNSTCKSEPVEIIENQEEVHHLMNSDAVATNSTCKSEPVEIIENQEVVDFKDTSEKSSEQILCKIEPTEDMSIQEEFHNQLPNTCIQSKDISEQSSSSGNQSIYCSDELLKENGILKKESESLNKKFSNLRSLITTYNEKLPVLQNKFSSVTAELNELKQKAETNEAKISTLKSDVQLLMSEILQHKKKVNEVTGKMKRQETSAILSSSFDSESFKSSLSLENEPSTNILSAEKGRTVMNKSINKDLYKNLNEGSGQQYAKDKQNKLQEALIEDRDADHTILNPEKTKTNIEKLSTENDCLQLRDCNYEKDEIQKFSSNQKDTELAVLSCSERDVDSSNTKTITIKKDELQMSLLKRKNIESVDSNYQERDSVVSNFIHLENPSLNRKRARFLPIPEDRKEHCRANTSVQQHDLCLIPCVTSLDIPESEKHSTGAEQVCLPTKGSLNTITAPCIAANEQFGKFTQNKCFKNPKSETNPQFTNAIQNIVKYINKRPISDSDFKSYVHSLFQFLVNPVNSPNISTLIFLVINHLCFTRRNYLKDFKKDQANCIFLPSSESCIVTTLFEIEKKSETYSQLKLIKNMLSTIHEFVRTWKKKYNIHGVASLCRVFTEICKRKKDLLSPLSLCADILKMRHIYAPYLIASIVGVWKEPFMVPSDNSDETMILIGAISLGVQNRTEDANCRGRYYLKDLILEYFGFPSLPGVNIAENLLKDKIISNCTQNSHEKSWMLTSSLVILATCKPWQWTRKHLIDDFILPNLSRFSSWEPHEKAFGLFCELYVDVYLLHPNIPNEESLIKYFEQASDKGIGFVKEWATVSLMKYLISKRRPIPSNFSEWLEKNKGKLSAETFYEFYQRRKVYSNDKCLRFEDIVIT
ncbi:uncharacterized protein LOC129980913 isoform X4 [Argiope bruennichi]|uniref:uncharacterized protein LOC129980913 isoform X4 n=1 Tax=Argiope bruennichi TaxID=94029 RepID=UPI00249582DF|nr:uncharacterized protein LOC129980913 isoform X4 [Argiope bruennichi]